ncbi:MAG: ATP synthase F1 subunit gamma [Planctomycetota bacterium]|jgi:F-type H+-transporting ATPase subunit gamma|nr:ATP synthase F1 subunit gamma [Planctomycetota bacterium]
MPTGDIKRRIRAIKNTQQITRAMKFVAAAKLRRARERMLAMRPYANAVDSLLRQVAEDMSGDEHPLFSPRRPVRRVAYVLIAGDRGLCGGFNTVLFRATDEYRRAHAGPEQVFFAVGGRAAGHLRKSGCRLLASYHDVFEKLSYLLAGEICDRLAAMFSEPGDRRLDEAYVIYNEFASMLTQRPVIRKILPFDIQELRRRRRAGAAAGGFDDGNPGKVLEELILEEEPDDIFDINDVEEELADQRAEIEAKVKAEPVRPIYNLLPDPAGALERLMARRMATEIHRALLESHAAELASRMTAMDNAAANAEEMVAGLTLELNRARQAGITMELLDIIGGSGVRGD